MPHVKFVFIIKKWFRYKQVCEELNNMQEYTVFPRTTLRIRISNE